MKRGKAKRVLHKLDYVPRWAWYVLSLLIAGPFGMVFVYLLFYALGKAAREEDEETTTRTYAEADYRDEDCTVTSDEDTKTHREQTRQSDARTQTAQPQADDGTQDVPDVEGEVREAVQRMRRADELIADPKLSEQIVSIEHSCETILSILEQRPQSLGEMRTFLRYYLPTTLKLLDARTRLENASTPRARQVMQRISEAIATVDTAFKKQIDALEEYRFIDLESELDVLRDMLKADGLLDDEENDPFASTQGGSDGTPLGGH